MSRTILLLEDDRDSRDALTMTLEDEGVAVAAVASGAEAFDYLARQPAPCVILLDLRMQDMTGAAFHARLKQQPAFAHIPVVLVSGDAEIGATAASLGVAGYCPKPFRLERLLSIVEPFCH